MTPRLIYSRPMAVYVADDEPQRDLQQSLLGRLFRSLLEALHRARADAAARELRRYRHFVRKDKENGES
jgi:hypothetical protein